MSPYKFMGEKGTLVAYMLEAIAKKKNGCTSFGPPITAQPLRV